MFIIELFALVFLTYFLVGLLLVAIDRKPRKEFTEDVQLSFKELDTDYHGLPECKKFWCRDGVELDFRSYPAESNNIIVFIHGSGGHSRYFYPLAQFLSTHLPIPDLFYHL